MAQKEERNRAEQLLKYSDYLYEMKQNQLDQKAMELQVIFLVVFHKIRL